MKRTLWNITLASVITLVAYIALYAIWGAILSELENPTLKLFLIAFMTTVAFGFFLLYTSKIRKSVGEDEVMSDYKDKKYTSLVDDLKLIIKREAKALICVAAIVLICFVLNTFDRLVFEKKTIVSFPAFFFAPMCLFANFIKIPFVGYLLSAVSDCLVYIIFLLIYRKKKYNYWMHNKG
ncbi:MAG: hypothetical protein E7636_04420 [Ruminococcaceae bacterium]|nr:hypothetical protein [Oscillospiraceae bacterium]